MEAVRFSQPSRSPDRQLLLPIIALGLVVLTAVLGGCSGRGSAEAYHRTQPSELYLYTPPNYAPGSTSQLLLALHGDGQDAFDCYDFWRTYADENGFILLCPQLPYSDGHMDRTAAQVLIGQALQTAYDEVNLRGTFFVVGFGEGGTLGLHYTSQFPQAVSGVVAIASQEFPALSSAARMPVLILAPSGNRAASDAAQAYDEEMTSQGFAIRLVMLDEKGNRLTEDAGRLTAQFLAETLHY
jgi:pimeloyl-ACP methyl ester carboxylesterase